MSDHEKINYVELPANDLDATKAFFSRTFNWEFTNYGEDYIAFSNAGLEGGFFRSELSSSSTQGSALIVLYSEDLEATLKKIEEDDHAKICQPIFHFPGGRRFHFLDPNGNELAVWSDVGIEVA